MHDRRLCLILTISKNRSMYDHYGEEGLKGGVSSPAARLSSLEAMGLPCLGLIRGTLMISSLSSLDSRVLLGPWVGEWNERGHEIFELDVWR
ncbi:hypothetical protein MA16_Dca000009 [Dendrobium catenatum]|uniref:Uncharacterized protein n=1 Tax=Dendrobium catenatum TaxID=906689 RepID=A0A2I0WSP2_9ASPA|nr:hypothetical protein MA16_Dca000009 [Dendrobium catenatum]